MRPAGAPLVLVLFLAACAALGVPRFVEPGIALNSVVVRSVGLTGGTLDVKLDIDNPNGFDLRGTRLTLGLDVEGTHFGDVVYDDDFTLTRNAVTTVTVPLTFEWAGVGAAARGILSYGEARYTMNGEARMTTPFGTGKVPFSREGRVRLTH